MEVKSDSPVTESSILEVFCQSGTPDRAMVCWWWRFKLRRVVFFLTTKAHLTSAWEYFYKSNTFLAHFNTFLTHLTLCIFISMHFCTRFNAWTKRWFLSGVFRRDLTINRESIQRENKGNRDDSREISAFLFSFFSVVFYAVFRYVILIFMKWTN